MHTRYAGLGAVALACGLFLALPQSHAVAHLRGLRLRDDGAQAALLETGDSDRSPHYGPKPYE